MQAHELKSSARKKSKKIGRGGKRGTTSGRGTKGQGAHGKKKDPLFEGGRSTLTERLKKVRGFKSPVVKRATVTLALLEKHFEAGATVTVEELLLKRAVTKNAKRAGVKVVATGTLSKALTLSKGIACSAGAKDIIEKQGGKVAE